MKTQFLLLGTSRLHRPFAKRINGIVTALHDEILSPVFARIGYFHTAAEILQAIRFMKRPSDYPVALREYMFRVEPRATTPHNEFDPLLEKSIREKTEFIVPRFFGDLRFAVIEISSLTVNRYSDTDLFFHTNPNFSRNVPYSDIYPQGYYQKFESGLLVQRIETSIEDLHSQLMKIRAELPDCEVFVLGHLRSVQFPNFARDRIHLYLSDVCPKAGCHYVDTASLLDEFGFASNNGVKDIHHLSDEGEQMLARHLLGRMKQFFG